MTIADRISNKRIELGYSQEDLAKKCGWSNRSSISHVESAGDHISLKKIQKIAKALNVSTSWLMGMDDSSETEKYINVIKDLKTYEKTDYSKLTLSLVEDYIAQLDLDKLEELDAFIEFQKIKKKNTLLSLIPFLLSIASLIFEIISYRYMYN